MSKDFEIRFHETERILEIRYPARPTVDTYARYELAVKEAISALGDPWSCLVDQSRLAVLPPELPPRIAKLNAWAKAHGMQRTVRVVKSSATAELQASRIVNNAGASKQALITRSFDEAWHALAGSAPLPRS